MDINNYSYCPHILDGEKDVYAEFIDHADFGYLTLTLEQWGCDHTKKMFVLSGYCLVNGKYEDISETFPADNTDEWETLRHGYEKAASRYNEIVPAQKAIPLF